MAVGTCSECGKEKELKNRTICETCRKRLQRSKKQGTGYPVSLDVGVSVSGSVGESPSSAERPRAEQQPTTENPEEWLARRVKETGSSGWQWVKTGTPPGAGPRIKLPTKWELSDIDQSLLYSWA